MTYSVGMNTNFLLSYLYWPRCPGLISNASVGAFWTDTQGLLQRFNNLPAPESLRIDGGVALGSTYMRIRRKLWQGCGKNSDFAVNRYAFSIEGWSIPLTGLSSIGLEQPDEDVDAYASEIRGPFSQPSGDRPLRLKLASPPRHPSTPTNIKCSPEFLPDTVAPSHRGALLCLRHFDQMLG